jgi:outer membrane protein assembly factor BamA
MQRKQLFMASLVLTLVSATVHADCIKNRDHRSNKNSGVLITDLIISGAQTLSSNELNEVRGELTGGCYNDDSDELQERIRAIFQNRGYFRFVLKSLSIKALDPLGLPKPVLLEADVQEGPRFRLAEIKFSGNHAFSSTKLRNGFPLKKGDLFKRDKIASGLDTLLKLYGKEGFLDFTSIPDTEFFSNATVLLNITIDEGPQYRMGKLEVFAKKEVAERLQAAWQLPEGAVFDLTYVDKYLNANRPLFPPEFSRDEVQVLRNCPNATVHVRLPIDVNSSISQPPMKNIECQTSLDSSESMH